MGGKEVLNPFLTHPYSFAASLAGHVFTIVYPTNGQVAWDGAGVLGERDQQRKATLFHLLFSTTTVIPQLPGGVLKNRLALLSLNGLYDI